MDTCAQMVARPLSHVPDYPGVWEGVRRMKGEELGNGLYVEAGFGDGVE